MRKPLAGKALFEAMGRRAYTQGLPLNYERAMRNSWPMWARCAWARGWFYQQPAHAATEANRLLDDAAAKGRMLRETVHQFLESAT